MSEIPALQNPTHIKEEDKFRLYRKVPLFSSDASYEELFRLKSWNAYLNGCLTLGDGKYLILNGDFKGEVWKYSSEPEGEYAPSKYRECFTPVSATRPHLLEIISEYLTGNV
ncbi:hypothetical protein QNI19_30090 [Cytophagaceae bacterium DM2B3-1]|uniref:Uncharacterized protein n=1 Tax=Xanthocytophaga flava TaxID=3048013 RepID=A0ABT7CWB7_9BACT|nr:hypothetical protein [Xanthocytophaga flavus]MDJ1472551.1 hypothetical protein [Xanthocytophaga flavus]MDJ1497227.1 hypothetical protein [Xanthocytophaga flavus]